MLDRVLTLKLPAPCIDVVYVMDLRGIRLAAEIEAQFSRMMTCMLQIWFALRSKLFGLCFDIQASSFTLHVLIDQNTEPFRRIAHITVHTLQTGINSKH